MLFDFLVFASNVDAVKFERGNNVKCLLNKSHLRAYFIPADSRNKSRLSGSLNQLPIRFLKRLANKQMYDYIGVLRACKECRLKLLYKEVSMRFFLFTLFWEL